VLWVTDPAAPALRPTKDVDVVLEVTTRAAFYDFERRLRDHGFAEDKLDGIICRWRHRASDLTLDATPADPRSLGFANRRQAAAIPHAIERRLPSGAAIRAVSPPYLLATKLEAFKSRGRDDFLASRDFGDIIALVDGREELTIEVARADYEVRSYIGSEVQRLLAHPRFPDGLFGALRPDAASQARAEAVVLPRLRGTIGVGDAQWSAEPLTDRYRPRRNA
jgi:hypothetical protein